MASQAFSDFFDSLFRGNDNRHLRIEMTLAFSRFGKKFFEPINVAVHAVVFFDALFRVFRQVPGERAVGKDALDGPGEGLGRSRRDEESVDFVSDHLPKASDVRGDDGYPAGLRFEDNVGGVLDPEGRDDDRLRLKIKAIKFLSRLHSGEGDVFFAGLSGLFQMVREVPGHSETDRVSQHACPLNFRVLYCFSPSFAVRVHFFMSCYGFLKSGFVICNDYGNLI